MRLVRDALAEMGFEVFWDQETPSGTDWDTWIREELAKSKCAVVFWSAKSVVSDNVRHEAVVAKEQRKLISVFLDQLPARDLPMGFYSQQAANLSKWEGDQENAEWRKFRSEFEAKLMPRWVLQKLNHLDAELEGERARRKTAEAREKSLRTQISKEAKKQQELKGDYDRALSEVEELRATVEERDKALQAQTAKQVETEQVLKSQRESALAEIAGLKSTVGELTNARSDDHARLMELSKLLSEAELQHSEDIIARDGALAEVATLKTVLQERDAAASEDRSAEQLENEQGRETERDRALSLGRDLQASKDYPAARAQYLHAAELGSASAMTELGNFCAYGRDYAEAKFWYEKAAVGGDPTAMLNLGDYYRDGRGVAKSLVEARTWYQRASTAGSPSAQDRLDALPKHK